MAVHTLVCHQPEVDVVLEGFPDETTYTLDPFYLGKVVVCRNSSCWCEPCCMPSLATCKCLRLQMAGRLSCIMFCFHFIWESMKWKQSDGYGMGMSQFLCGTKITRLCTKLDFSRDPYEMFASKLCRPDPHRASRRISLNLPIDMLLW